MRMHLLVTVGCLAALGCGSFAQEAKHTYQPPAGYVPDAATAIKIAVAVWEAIYGADQIAGEKPFHAALKDGIWIVEGSLPPKYSGGVALAEIAKEDARILRVTHGR